MDFGHDWHLARIDESFASDSVSNPPTFIAPEVRPGGEAELGHLFR